MLFLSIFGLFTPEGVYSIRVCLSNDLNKACPAQPSLTKLLKPPSLLPTIPSRFHLSHSSQFPMANEIYTPHATPANAPTKFLPCTDLTSVKLTSDTAGQSFAAANMRAQNSAFAAAQTLPKSTRLKSTAPALDQYFAAEGKLVMRGAWTMAWRREWVKVLKRRVLRAAPMVWSRRNLRMVFVRERGGGCDGEDGGDFLGFEGCLGEGCAGNVDSRKSCLLGGLVEMFVI